jgi:hypothetical protein
LGGIALVAGAIGIANVMVIADLARRSEIGVRRGFWGDAPARRGAICAALGVRRWSAVVCGVSKNTCRRRSGG